MIRAIASPSAAGSPLERPHQQRRRRAAVLGVRIPRAARELGRDEPRRWTHEHGARESWRHTVAPGYTDPDEPGNGTPRDEATFTVKAGLAEMLKGGVIMDVVTPEQAKIAEDAGAAAVMALERVPADIRRDGGVARMSDPAMIKGIQEAVTIPVMAKARIGHFVEAQVLEALEVDYVDESEVLTPADEANHIDKWAFKVPFVCGATNLGEALRRIGEGAAMIRSKGEAGTGDIVEAVRHLRKIRGEITPPDDARRHRDRDRRQGARRAAAPRPPGRGRRAAAGRAVLRRRDRDPGRCLAGDAARRRGRVRRLRDLQVRGSGAPGARDRRGDDALSRIRPGSPPPRPASASRWSASRPRSSRPSSCSPRAAGRPWQRAALTQAQLVGILALQGDFEAHAKILRALGAQPREVRVPADLDGLDALIIPGGESTVMTLGIEREGLAEPLRELVAGGTPVLGTCAGMIMLDRDHLDVLDIRAERNAFGRQLRSFEAELELDGVAGGPLHAVFIRAPWVAEHGDEVEVLAEVDDHPVAVRQGERDRRRVPSRAGGRDPAARAAARAQRPRRVRIWAVGWRRRGRSESTIGRRERDGWEPCAGVERARPALRAPLLRRFRARAPRRRGTRARTSPSRTVGTPSGSGGGCSSTGSSPSGGSSESLPRESHAASAQTMIPAA